MFRVVVRLVIAATPPTYVERFFGRRIAKPVVTHVPRLRSFRFHILSDKRSCGGIVSLKDCGRLKVAESVEKAADVDDLLAVEEGASGFGFGGGGDDVFNKFANDVEGGIMKSTEEIRQKIVPGDSALSAGSDKVGGVGVDVEDHVGREEAYGGRRVSGAIVHE